MARQQAKTVIRALRLVVLMCCVAVVPGLGIAQENAVRHGLMWHRTGLPAVFPLQVKTAVGRNYYLTLRDAQTAAPALAAYIEGGRFFQVLVPPGTFALRFDYGGIWQGEADLFGGAGRTGTFELAEPLTFEVRSFSVKGGHIIDLTSLLPGREAQVDTGPRSICQTQRLVTDAQDRDPEERDRQGAMPPKTLVFHATPLAEREAQLGPDVVLPDELRGKQRLRDIPRFDIRQRLC